MSKKIPEKSEKLVTEEIDTTWFNASFGLVIGLGVAGVAVASAIALIPKDEGPLSKDEVIFLQELDGNEEEAIL